MYYLLHLRFSVAQEDVNSIVLAFSVLVLVEERRTVNVFACVCVGVLYGAVFLRSGNENSRSQSDGLLAESTKSL